MRDRDSLQRFAFEAFPARGQLVHLNSAWQALLECSDYPDQIRPLLGQALAAAVLLTSTLKFKGRMTLQLQGDGPLYLIVVQCTHDLNVRGLARWRSEVPLSDLRAQLGAGRLVITIQSDVRSEPYQGVVALNGATLNECLAKYFHASEQLPTRLWLAADDQTAAGLLLQRMPGGHPSSAEEDWSRVQLLADTVRDDELIGIENLTLLKRLFDKDDLRVFDSRPVRFHCSCSTDRIETMLRSLGEAELRSILSEQDQIAVDCEICNKKRQFDRIDVARIIAGKAGPDSPTSLH